MFVGAPVFGALVTNAMAHVAAAAMILLKDLSIKAERGCGKFFVEFNWFANAFQCVICVIVFAHYVSSIIFFSKSSTIVHIISSAISTLIRHVFMTRS